MRKTLAAATSLLAAVAGTLVATAPASASGPLKEHAVAHGRYFGDAVDTGEITDAAYRPHIAAEFSQPTPGNAMKWDATEPSPGQFSYARGDEIVALAQQNGQTVRGHTLVWHSQTPGWVQNLDATALRALHNHISNVVTHYRGALYAWDVVNEPLNEDGTLRNSFWLQKPGPDYIADAFRAARAADPDVKLYINDYNTDGIGTKSDGMYRLVQSLLADGVPIDGVGFQAHLAVQYGFPSRMPQNLQRFADLGLDVAITELDVRMQLPADASKLATQATYYRNVTNACLAVARCVGITTWGYTDRYSWVPSTFPGAGAALSWTASTDAGGTGLAGYTVYRADGTALARTTTNPASLTGLTPSTRYQVYVRARDGAGNLSPPSATATFATTAGQADGCVVGYHASNWSGGGFTATVTISNTGTTAVDGWTLGFTFPSGQRVTLPAWSADWSQTGQQVSATNLPRNQTIAPNGSIEIGFNGTCADAGTAPAAFTVNGTTCATA